MRWVEFPYRDNSLVSSNRDEYCRSAGRGMDLGRLRRRRNVPVGNAHQAATDAPPRHWAPGALGRDADAGLRTDAYTSVLMY